MTDKTREARLRRMAHRQRLQLVKSRSRNPRAIEHGRYMVVDPVVNGVVFGTGAIGRPTATLDDVEAFLTD
jgi:hypothetical protein